MKYILLLSLLAFSITIFAQKNVIMVTASSVTEIALPAGSKKDSRILSTAGADMLLSLETSKVNATLSGTEVLMLPVAARGGFNKDSLALRLKAVGWSIIVVEGDEKFSWLHKDKRTVIAYFSADSKSTNLYFSNAAIPTEQKTELKEQKQAPVTTTFTSHSTPSINSAPPDPSTLSTYSTPATGIFAFTTTNFDDGWTGTVKDDWVQVVKGSITVLLHFPNKSIEASSYDYNGITSNAWNKLVAARYSNLQNFSIFSGAVEYEPTYFGMGDVTDNASGKRVFVILFMKGNGGWVEVISPDRNSFVQTFGIDINKADYYTGSSMWDPLRNLSYYNRFAVGQADIRGKWTSNFAGMQQYVNAYTGADAGMDTYSSSQIFEFEADGRYRWEISVASGFVGSIKFQNVKSSGTATLPNNWQIHFSDLEGKPRTYNAYFSCIKGARILWLEDTSYPTGYKGYGKM